MATTETGGDPGDVLQQLASAQGAKTQDANCRVAERIAAPGADPGLIAGIAAGLSSRDARLRGDCAEVLTQVAELEPAHVAPYAAQLFALLGDRNGRVRWESAHALALIAALVPERMAEELPSLAAIVRHDPSVIVRDYLLDAVAGYAATGDAAAGAALPILFEGLGLFGQRHAGRVLRGLAAVAASCPRRASAIAAAAEPFGADPRPAVRKAVAACCAKDADALPPARACRGARRRGTADAEEPMRALGLVAALSLATACSDPQASNPPGTAGADLGPGDLGAQRARIVGSVVDLDRRGLPGARVQLCGAPCREFTTNGDGLFEIPGVEGGDYGVHIELPAADPLLYGKVVLPLYYFDPRATPVRALPMTVVPRLGPQVALGTGRQTVAIDGTLSLSFDADALRFPPGSGAPRVAGVRIPAGLYPDFCLPGGDGRIVAEWALGPFAVESTAPIDVHIADGLGLGAGSAVFLSTIDPATGRPDRQGYGRVAADGKSIDSTALMGIRRLTWLVVSLPGGGA